jgi:hypothetical protein
MALKTETKPATEPAAQPQAQPQTTVLELALYTQYTWGGETYEKGKPYRFRSVDAMKLLAETDTGRPVWKLYQAPKPRQAPKNEIMDATGVQVTVPGEPINVPPAAKRIDIGSDDEIQDILKNEGGDVTV